MLLPVRAGVYNGVYTMDDKKQVKNFVDMMDAYMSNGGGHIKMNDTARDILVNKEAGSESFSKLAEMSNACPECANIPNISDVDDDNN